MRELALVEVGASLGGRMVLDGVSLTVPGGRLVGLTGPNGAGKTTLLRAAAGLIAPSRGQIRLDGVPLPDLPRRHLARNLSYLPQRGPIHWPLTVRRLVLLGRLPHGAPWAGVSKPDRVAVERAMARVGIAGLAERPVSTLSGGEAARVLFARALAVEAPVLVADEPIAALDPYFQLQAMELLAEEARRGTAVLAVLHDLSLASRFCDDLVLLAGGRVLAHGPAAQVLHPDMVARAYGVTVWEAGPEGERFVTPWRRLDGNADLH